MFLCNNEEMISYTKCMDTIKKMNREYYDIRKSDYYKVGMVIVSTLKMIKKFDFKNLKKNYSRWILGKKSVKFSRKETTFQIKMDETNLYFSEHRIAVYTVIFGNYDELLEPLFVPNNVDYYVITDQELDLSNSVWKKVDISAYEDQIYGLSNVEKNRFFKMKPYEVFGDYYASVYIDGNIKVVSDLTEFVNRIGKWDVAMHSHFCRECVYDECEAILLAKKEKRINIARHIEYFKKTQMPKGYGLLECNVIARKHTPLCEKIMGEWWEEFRTCSKRDQLSFPHVLYRNGIPVMEVATLGTNVFMNPAIRVVTHA